MKFHTSHQISEIKRLQEEARTCGAKCLRDLEDADKLVKELKEYAGEKFVYDGIPYKLQHGAIGFGKVGNRDWLLLDTDIRIID